MDGTQNLMRVTRDKSLSFSAAPWPLFTTRPARLTIRDLQRCINRLCRVQVSRALPLREATLRVVVGEGDRKQDQTILLATQACHFGGERYWFVCPTCKGRAYSLYPHGGLSCWRCAGLRYVSRTWSDECKLWRHYDVLATALRYRPGPKPARFFRYAIYAQVHFARDMARLLRRIERRRT